MVEPSGTNEEWMDNGDEDWEVDQNMPDPLTLPPKQPSITSIVISDKNYKIISQDQIF